MNAETIENRFYQSLEHRNLSMCFARGDLEYAKELRRQGDPSEAAFYLAHAVKHYQDAVQWQRRMDRPLTWRELYALAEAHYSHGGNGIVECWDENTFNSMVAGFGPYNYKKAMALLELYYEDDKEMGLC